jgi:hypothetical protein
LNWKITQIKFLLHYYTCWNVSKITKRSFLNTTTLVTVLIIKKSFTPKNWQLKISSKIKNLKPIVHRLKGKIIKIMKHQWAIIVSCQTSFNLSRNMISDLEMPRSLNKQRDIVIFLCFLTSMSSVMSVYSLMWCCNPYRNDVSFLLLYQSYTRDQKLSI